MLARSAMSPPQWTRRGVISVATVLLLQASIAGALDATYCSSENTASGNPILVYSAMSEGKCHDTCLYSGTTWAYGITHNEKCWCSNIKPGELTSLSACDLPCPGYPYETCGSKDPYLFNYVALGNKPSGTSGGNFPNPSSDSTSYTPSTPVTTPTPKPVTRTVPETVTKTKIYTKHGSATTETISGAITITTTPSPTASGTPVTTTEVFTSNGVVTTQTVTSIATAPPVSSVTPQLTETHTGLSSGAVAGLTIGVIAAVAILGLLIYFCCWRPRRKRSLDGEEQGLNRNTSVLSKVGLLRSGSRNLPTSSSATRTGTSAAVPSSISSKPPRLQTDIPGVSGGPSSAATNITMASRRDSRPIFVDQRLNPNALMAHENLSRTSVGTLQDDKDYSRPLEVRNPDPPR